jgi:hypothetical protein
MSPEHERTARVLDPSYVSGLGDRSLTDLRAMHDECVELETEVSYVRRVTQARIDILRAEVARRERGESIEDLIRALPQILSDPGPRGAPASSHLPLKLAPEEDSEWNAELAEFDTVLAELPTLSDDALADSIERLQTVEREVSAERRALHAVLDRIDVRLGELLTSQ